MTPTKLKIPNPKTDITYANINTKAKIPINFAFSFSITENPPSNSLIKSI